MNEEWATLDAVTTIEACTTVIPGPRSLTLAQTLRQFEARNITFLSDEYPIFWASASGATVTDVDQNRYLDLSSAFGVANVGHTNARVLAALTNQAQLLMHGMGDVHPTEIRTQLLARLASVTPGRLAQSFLGCNGSDAVETARKTAWLVTQRPGSLSFTGAYHGLSYGTLDLIGIERFATPFSSQLSPSLQQRLPYPTAGSMSLDAALTMLETTLQQHPEIGMLIIEPIAGRAGTLVPIPGYLSGMRKLADRFGVVLVFDEIYTGFGRTGRWFACEHEAVIPDLLCLGKALGGGMPLSAVIGLPEIMDAWPASTGEALHTSTFLGNPLACASALAVLDEIERLSLPERAEHLGLLLGHRLRGIAEQLKALLGHDVEARGQGMMWALDLHDAHLAHRTVIAALHRGLLLLQQGAQGTALAITPPLIISHHQLERALELLSDALAAAQKGR